MNFRRWVVFTFLIHVLVVGIDKGGGLILYLLTKNRAAEHGKAGILASMPFILMALANLGLATSLVYFVRRGRYTPQQAFETTATVATVWGGLIAVLAAVVALYVLPLLNGKWVFDPNVVLPICIGVPFLLLASYSNSIQLATERVKDYGTVHLVSSLLFLPAFFTCYFWFGGDVTQGDVPMAVAWGRLITSMLVAILTVFLVRRVVKLRLGLHPAFLRDSLRYGWKANLTSTLTYLNHRIDLLVLWAVFLAPAALTDKAADDFISQEVAFYSVAVTWAELVWHFPEAMRDLFFSKVAGSTHEKARELTPVLCRMGLVVSLVGGVAILLLINPVMGSITWVADSFGHSAGDNAWYRTWSTPVSHALLLLAPGTVAFTVSKILQADLAARDRMQACVNAQWIVLVTMLALDVLLIPDMGAAGAAIASTVSYVLATGYTVWVYARDVRVPAWTCLVMHRADLVYLREIGAAVWQKLRRKNRRPA